MHEVWGGRGTNPHIPHTHAPIKACKTAPLFVVSLSVHSLIRFSLFSCSSVNPCIHLCVCLSIHPSIHHFSYPLIDASVHPLKHPSFCPVIHPSIHSMFSSPCFPSNHSPIHLSIHPSIRSPIQKVISCIHSLSQLSLSPFVHILVT